MFEHKIIIRQAHTGEQNQTVIKKHEWRFVLLFSIIMVVLAALPYIMAYRMSPPDKQFTGVHIVNAYDTYWYISLIEQAREGNILFKYLSFPEYQQPIIFHPLFLFMGQFARIFSLPNIFVYHLFRFLLGFVFLWTAYVFISYFLENPLKRKIALIFLAAGSGLGWLAALFIKFDVFTSGDFWIKEINGFLTLYESPLDLMGNILMIITLLGFLKLTETAAKAAQGTATKKPTGYALISGLGLLLLLFVHPYVVLTIILVMLIYLAYLASKRIKITPLLSPLALMLLIALPGFLYNYYAVTVSPAISFWLRSSGTPYEATLSYFGFFIIGLGLLLVFSALALKKVLKEGNDKMHFLLIWFSAAFILAFQPWIYFQIKFLEGIMIAVSILAAKGLFILIEYLRKYPILRIPRELTTRALIPIFAITAITNGVIIARDVSFYTTKATPFYLEKEYVDAFSWIKNNTQKNEIILANRDLSYFIPGSTGNPIFMGLLVYEKTDYHKKKISDLKWFFESNASAQEKYDFLKKNNIGYFLYAPLSAGKENTNIFYGKEYYYDLSSFAPQSIPGLKEVYSNQKTLIYEVE